jgi:ribosomal protein L16 Arg81 hydroxylase
MFDPPYDSLEGWRVELTPGDLLIIPSQWLHYVETLETSLTYSAAWIDETNWERYVEEAKRKL